MQLLLALNEASIFMLQRWYWWTLAGCVAHTASSSHMHQGLCLPVLPQNPCRFLEYPFKDSTIFFKRRTDAYFHILQSAKFRRCKARLYSYFFNSVEYIHGTKTAFLATSISFLKIWFLFWCLRSGAMFSWEWILSLLITLF